MLDDLPAPPDYFLNRLQALQRRLRDHVCAARDAASVEAMAAVGDHRDGDTLYAIDLHSEEVLITFCQEWGQEMPFALIAEGIPGNGWRIFPEGAKPADARFCLVVDPIDGTRMLMYDKRSAWVLSAVAPNYGEATGMHHIALAMQTEIPTTRQHLADVLWAVHGQGARAERHNLLTGEVSPYTPQPSRAPTLAHGFAGITKFFPGARDWVGRLEEALFERLLGTPQDGNPLVFDDQYVSTGGQLYELIVGHDRFNADLRPLEPTKPSARNVRRLCCHPYDLCTELIAREAGVVITGPDGGPIKAPLDIRANVAWIGYANPQIQALVEPVLLGLLHSWHEGTNESGQPVG